MNIKEGLFLKRLVTIGISFLFVFVEPNKFFEGYHCLRDPTKKGH